MDKCAFLNWGLGGFNGFMRPRGLRGFQTQRIKCENAGIPKMQVQTRFSKACSFVQQDVQGKGAHFKTGIHDIAVIQGTQGVQRISDKVNQV